MCDDNFQDVQAQLSILSASLRGRSFRSRRNRLLVSVASHSPLPVKQIVDLKVWQLTRYLVDDRRHSDLPRRSLYPAHPRALLGIYTDDSFAKISPLCGLDQRAVSQYLKSLLDFVGAEAPLFPVVRKGDHIDIHASLTVKDLRNIVVSGFIRAEKPKTVTAYTFRHQAIARLLLAGASVEQIQHEGEIADPQMIRDIATTYGLETTRDRTFTAPKLTGVCIEGTVYERFENFYPRTLYCV